MDFTKIEDVLCRRIKNKKLFEAAFTHKSASDNNYEKLEFLGDAVLNLAVADYLYKEIGKKNKQGSAEGKMSIKRKTLVCEQSLVRAIKLSGLDEFLVTGNKAMVTDSMRADLFEAIVGAIYCDGGIGQSCEFVFKFLIEPLGDDLAEQKDYKSLLIEKLVKLHGKGPQYCTTEIGTATNRNFECEIVFHGNVLSKGYGHNKKEAERQAAERAYKLTNGE